MRYEYKYYVPLAQLDNLRNRMLPFMRLDPFAAKFNGQYTVRSIYMDTPDMEMYHTKQAGIANRQKVRLRGYNVGNENSEVFLEIKRKYQGPIQKNRGILTFGEFLNFVREGHPPTDVEHRKSSIDINRFFYQLYARRLRPIVNVVYEREAYQPMHNDPENDFRITIDKNLRCAAWPQLPDLYKEAGLRYVLTDVVILELKFNKFLPVWAKPIVASIQLNKEPASKYVLCIDALNDQIHTNDPHELLLRGRFF